MDKTDFILELDRRLQKAFKQPIGVSITVSYKTLNEGIKDLTIPRFDWSQCNSRFDRWNLIQARI